MKECTGTDKPLVSILMATYNPRIEWLREQLVSLNNQSYENLELLILDDCSTKVPAEIIKECAAECITRFLFVFTRNEENLGSTKTFEQLTLQAKGEYIAYCDQDDIWKPEKIETLVDCFAQENIALAYSDVKVIDGYGKIIAENITKFRARHVLYEGPDLAAKLLVQNFVIGCTMMIKRDAAQSMTPFESGMVHDHYLALMISLNGTLRLCKTPLISYRIHEENQTSTLAGIKNKSDYIQIKIKGFCDRLHRLESKYEVSQIPGFQSVVRWAEARNSYSDRKYSSLKIIWKYRNFDFKLSIFEMLMLRMPDPVFKIALKFVKEGNL